MIRGARPFDDSVDNTPFDTAVEATMAAMLLFLPLAFGTTEPWSQQVWFGLIAAMGLSVLLKGFFYRTTSAGWTWAYVPIALFIALTVLQFVPLPRAAIHAVSPATLSLKDELLRGASAGGSETISFYGLATERHVRLVLAVASLFVIVLQTYRSLARLRRLLITITITGLAVAVLAGYQDLAGTQLIYGLVPIGHKNAGPFQNYSHFSQFMNLSMGAALALILLSLVDWSSSGLRGGELIEEAKRPQNAVVWAAVALCLVGPLLVFASMSRMGMLSMLVAAGVTAGLLGLFGHRGGRRRRGEGHAFVIVTVAVVVFAVLLAFGFEAVYDRIATLRNVQETSVTARWQILQDLAVVWKTFTWVGTGLGTHEFVFPMFSRQDATALFTHAENEYAQLLEETGVVGMTMIVTFLLAAVAAFFRTVRSPKRPEQFVAFGLGFGLVAILVHSATDFGQHVPAVATLSAISFAVLFGLARSTKPTPTLTKRHSVLRPMLVRGVATAVFVVGAAWVIYGGDRDRRAAAAFTDAQQTARGLGETNWQDDDEYRRLLTSAAMAAEIQPRDVAYQHWLATWRWGLLTRDTADAATGELSLTEEQVGFARQLVADLDAAHRLCPTFGPPLGLAGQLRASVLQQPEGQADIRTAYRLTPHDAQLSRLAGLQALADKDFATADVALGRYIRLGGPRWQVVDAYLRANRPDLAQAAASGDRWNLLRLAGGLDQWPGQGERALACRAEADRLLIAASEAPDAAPEVFIERANFEAGKGNVEASIEWLQRAVDQAYDRVDWRILLARSQAAAGHRDDAVRNLRVCLRLRPKMAEAEGLLATYSSGRQGDRAVTP